MNTDKAAWIKIPGYPYWINSAGTEIRNQNGHTLKPIQVTGELGYELRQCGQRDKLSLRDIHILVGMEEKHEDP